jgi:hypothetical protein
MADEDDSRTPLDDAENEAPKQPGRAGDEGLGTRTGAVDGPDEGGPGLGKEKGSGGQDDIGESGRGRH